MKDTSAEILTAAINQMRACKLNDVEISINMLGASVPVMVEAGGAKHAADFLRNLADSLENENDTLSSVN